MFWVAANHRWVEAKHLTIGEVLRTDAGSIATVADTTVVSGAADMWDLTVDNDHDFYTVTTIANVLVHNNRSWTMAAACERRNQEAKWG